MKRSLFPIAILIACSAAGILSCSRNEPESQDVAQSKSAMDDETKQLKDLQKKIEESQGTEVVDFREFQRFFPPVVEGYRRASFGGETTGMMGFNVSIAEATYKKNDSEIEVKVTDAGGAGAVMMSLASWSNLTVDREDSESLERTGTWKGHKSFEQWDKRSNESEFTLIIDERLIFTAEAENMKLEVLKTFVQSFNPAGIAQAVVK